MTKPEGYVSYPEEQPIAITMTVAGNNADELVIVVEARWNPLSGPQPDNLSLAMALAMPMSLPAFIDFFITALASSGMDIETIVTTFDDLQNQNKMRMRQIQNKKNYN